MPSDLLLLAVRYISNELSDDEMAAFERLLADDQSAREAVAEAVELTLVVAQLPATTPDLLPLRAKRRLYRPMRLGLAAACLGAVVGLTFQYGRFADPNPAVDPSIANANPNPPEAVAIAWSGLRQTGEIDLVSHTELLAWLDEPIASPSADLPSVGASALEDELLPRWLLEAASLRETPETSGAGTREN
ncbi:transposase [Singulisphaera sp. Ch08]|uniref:Transposase n=1 Tax=Singulisphaera sp. Ch08 TaxID=3120278 RepID=A0AAU7CSD9_9BACT